MPSEQTLRNKILKLAAKKLSVSEIARRLKIARSSVSYWIERKDRPAKSRPTVDPVEAERQKAEAEAKRKEHLQAVKELAFRGFMERIVRDNVPPMPAVKCRPTSTRRQRSLERFPLLTLNDLHFEEQVKPAGVMGLNEYDIAIACRRLYRIIHAAIAWKRDMEAAGRITLPTLTVALLGDFLTGTLHGLERHSDAPNIVRAALACGDVLALALRDLAAEFKSIQVVGVVGNHGRLPDDRKVPTKDPTRSWDFLAYQVAKRRLDGQRNISWFLPESYGVLFDVGGHCCYASHGNFIPNNLGIVGYGVRRFASALASNLNAAGKRLRYCFFGHFHQSNAAEFAGVKAFICPSLIGTQEYSFLGNGAVNEPAQQLHVMDRSLGLVSQETLYGEGSGYEGTYSVSI